MNGYDFDKTIYQGDSSIDFYWFCLRKNKKVLLQLPQQIWGLIRYTLGFIDRTKFKEYFFSFLKNNKDTKKYVEEFWNKKISKIKPWYIEQKNKSDVILSASPEFLLKPLAQKLGVKVIASKVDIKSGKFLQKNCRGEEKARQFKAEYKNTRLESFYSDSMVDRPMMNLADKAYYVKGDRIYDLNECGGGIVRCVKVDKMIFYAGILFLLIPVLLQLGFWFRKMVAIPCIVLLITATIFALNRFKPLSQMEYHKFFDKRKMFFLAILIIIINLLSGAGGIFPQNWDYNGRNAIFHDLINHEWPVRYDYSGEGLEYERDEFGNEGLLNYYFAWWLPGALVGKATNFEVASVFMLIWQTIGVTFFFYYVCRLFRNVKYRYFFIFLAFGGLNVIGYVIMKNYRGLPAFPIGTEHIDTSMAPFCMSSFITQLFWVFNQSIPAWIATMLFLQEKDYRTCGYYFALLVPFGPFPMLGFFYIVACYVIFGKKLNKMVDLRRIKQLLSTENICACIAILPILFMYTLNESRKGLVFMNEMSSEEMQAAILKYVLYVILEFLVYIVIINKKNYRQMIMCFLFFAIAPLFYIGGPDLGNRATIPLLVILYLLICEDLNVMRRKSVTQKLLIVILLIAAVTNFNEIYRSLKNKYLATVNGYSLYADNYRTFEAFKDKECAEFITNFVVKYDENNEILQWILRK